MATKVCHNWNQQRDKHILAIAASDILWRLVRQKLKFNFYILVYTYTYSINYPAISIINYDGVAKPSGTSGSNGFSFQLVWICRNMATLPIPTHYADVDSVHVLNAWLRYTKLIQEKRVTHQRFRNTVWIWTFRKLCWCQFLMHIPGFPFPLDSLRFFCS